MEEIAEIIEKEIKFERELKELKNELKRNFISRLWSQDTTTRGSDEHSLQEKNKTPQQSKKRPKRLTAVEENEEKSTPNPIARPKIHSLLETVEDQPNSIVSSSKPIVEQSEVDTSKSKCEVTEKSALVASKSAVELMPAPPPPTAVSASISEPPTSGRPQRAAKINCEKNLKEPSLNKKLRRPSGLEETVKIKVEHEQRASQMHEATSSTVSTAVSSKASTVSNMSQESIIVTNKAPSIVSVASDLDNDAEKSINIQNSIRDSGIRPLCIRIKREKISLENTTQPQNSEKNETYSNVVESSISTTILSTTATNSTNVKINTTQNKKGRKNKIVPKPIKVERLSDVANEPIAARTRKNSFENKRNSNKNTETETESKMEGEKEKEPQQQADRSIYEEAMDDLPVAAVISAIQPKANITTVINETVTISQTNNLSDGMIAANSTVVLGTAPNDATYCTANAGTFILDQQTSSGAVTDLTFDVNNEKRDSQRSSKQSMETARDTLQPREESLITDDESDEIPATPVIKTIIPPPQAPTVTLNKPSVPTLSSSKTLPMPSKTCNMPQRTIEIFNPLVQSPVKKKVEAYENVAAQATLNGKRTRSKLAKENSTPSLQSSSITPLIGRLNGPALGRFLTPSQSSNTVTPNAMAQAKKIPASASKAMTLPKSNSAGNLRSAAPSSAKGLSRENSVEDFRKGIHQIAEERKKQREQKHLLAAQQREAKERERAERLAKVAREREEKRLKKQQEAEQKKRELDEIQRQLRAEEEASAAEHAKQKAKVLMEQEKAMLQKLKQQQQSQSATAKMRMLPPKPKTLNKYTFDMLHEDDSTDDENKTTYKRPPPPQWSRSHVRGAAILLQQHMPTDIIDSFFSVQPMTPDLKTIFPAIDSRYLRRNSSAIWSSPTRYSELPKY